MRYQQDQDFTCAVNQCGSHHCKGSVEPKQWQGRRWPTSSGSNYPCRTQALPLWEGALTSHGERGGRFHFAHAVLGDAGVRSLVRAHGFLNAQRVVVLDVVPVSQQKNGNAFRGQRKRTKSYHPENASRNLSWSQLWKIKYYPALDNSTKH